MPQLAQRYFQVARKMGLLTSDQAVLAFEDLFAGVDLANKRMLDVGGGTGIFTYYAACMGAREVVCLEPELDGSTAGVRGSFHLLRAEFPDVPVKLDARTIQEFSTNEKFDVVLLHASINHIDEPACIRLLEEEGARDAYRRVFAHIRELANPGASLIVYDCTRYNFFPLVGMKNPLRPTIEWHKHQKPEVWARLLAEVGFRDPKIGWEPLYCFGRPGRLLLRNKVAAFFLKGGFRLHMEKT
jgi:SAM-dependent methyltransferase